ncbi:hypothetical protein D3C78_1542120 [compost metagenome]
MRDGADEFEELRGPQDGVGDTRFLDQLLLGHLGPEVATFEHPLGADDGKGDVMPDLGSLLRGEDIAPGYFEELQRGGVFERRRVGDVDDHVSALQRFA